MNNESTTNKLFDSTFSKFVGFGADILGFGGGIIGIISYLRAVQISTNNNLEVGSLLFTSPFYILIFWFFSFYIYLAFLHKFWKSQKEKDDTLSSSFGISVRDDFLRSFKYPFRFSIFYVFILLYVFIIIYFFLFYGIDLSPVVSVGFFIPTLLVLSIFFSKSSYSSDFDRRHALRKEKLKVMEKKLNEDLQANWEKWDHRITIELENTDKGYLEYADFKDQIDKFDLDTDSIKLVFIEYKSKHPESVMYGQIYNENSQYNLPINSNFVLYKRGTKLAQPFYFK